MSQARNTLPRVCCLGPFRSPPDSVTFRKLSQVWCMKIYNRPIRKGNAMDGHLDLFDILAVVTYLCVTAYLGWLGWRRTCSAADYMLAGRTTHPFVMALSYGATF